MKRPDAWDDNDRIRRDGMKTLVAAALRSNTVTSILYPSVSFFYADGGADRIDATTAQKETSRTQASTLDAESNVMQFAESAPHRRGIVLRLGAFYGPTSADSRQTLAMARKGFALPLAPTDAYRSLLWIDDAASALTMALARAPSGVFDVVEDSPCTQAESLAALAAAVGRKRLRALPRWLLRFALPADLRDLLARSQRISNRRFCEATGWRPQVADQKSGWTRMAAAYGKDRPEHDTFAVTG